MWSKGWIWTESAQVPRFPELPAPGLPLKVQDHLIPWIGGFLPAEKGIHMLVWHGHPRSSIPESLKSLNPKSSIQCPRQKMIKCLKEPWRLGLPPAHPNVRRPRPEPGTKSTASARRPLRASGQPAQCSPHTKCLASP